MNPKMMIYIILSVILLYFYYHKRDLSILFAFIVLVSSTLIFGKNVREGATSGGGGRGSGRGSGECKDMGFKKTEIVKNKDGDVGESLENELKNIKTVADNHWPYDEKGESNNVKEKESMKEFAGIYFKEVTDNKLKNEESENVDLFTQIAQSVWSEVYNPDKSKRRKINLKPDDLPKGYLTKAVSGGDTLVTILDKVGKSKELKNDGAKNIHKYLVCLCKKWTAIFKKLDAMADLKKDKKKEVE
jgi:hypothetical protein